MAAVCLLSLILLLQTLSIQSPAYAKGIANNSNRIDPSEPVKNPDEEKKKEEARKAEAARREREAQEELRRLQRQKEIEEQRLRELRREAERREQERIAFEQMHARIKAEQELEAQRLRNEALRLENLAKELEIMRLEQQHLKQQLREQAEQNRLLQEELQRNAQALLRQNDQLYNESQQHQQDNYQENNLTDNEQNALSNDDISASEVEIEEDDNDIPGKAFLAHLNDNFYYPYDIYSYSHYPFDKISEELEIPKSEHKIPSRIKSGSIEEATYDISFAWLNKNPSYLMRHTTKNSKIAIYYTNRKSHVLSQKEYYLLSTEAFLNTKTSALNFRSINKTNNTAAATAMHEFYTGDIKRRVSVKYYFNRMNGIWLINRIDIIKPQGK